MLGLRGRSYLEAPLRITMRGDEFELDCGEEAAADKFLLGTRVN